MVLTSIYKRKGRAGVTLEYQDPQSGGLRQKAFPTRADAIAYRDSVREAWNVQPDVHARADVPFEEYAYRWLRATKTAVRAGTARIYESAIRVHLVPFFKGSLRGVTRSGVRDLVTQLREGGMKKKSIHNIRGTLHAILEAAVEEERIKANPAHFRSKSNLMRLTPTSGERRASIKAFDLKQAPKFFAAAPAAAPLHNMLWRTMVATGLRPGEAAALRPEDLDYDGLRIQLERAVTRGVVGPCKTQAPGEVDVIGMPAGLADELRAWEVETAREALAAGRSRSEWLFPSSTGGLLDEKGAADAFKRTLKRAGLPGHFSQHCLRHTFATHELKAGTPIQDVAWQLRHRDIRMTFSVYGSHLPAPDRASLDRHYERLLGGQRMSEEPVSSGDERREKARSVHRGKA